MRRYVVALLAASLLLVGCGASGTVYKGSYNDLSSSSQPSGPSATASGTDPVSGLPWISVSQITPEGRTVLQEIAHGGPFAYPGKDGSVFGNFEGELPKEGRGYYHEYTVPTPGAHNRGTRRIITGSHGEVYWTADHYEHFARIKETITR